MIGGKIPNPWSFKFHSYFELFRNFRGNYHASRKKAVSDHLSWMNLIFSWCRFSCYICVRFWLVADHSDCAIIDPICWGSGFIRKNHPYRAGITIPYRSASSAYHFYLHWTKCPLILYNKYSAYYIHFYTILRSIL